MRPPEFPEPLQQKSQSTNVLLDQIGTVEVFLFLLEFGFTESFRHNQKLISTVPVKQSSYVHMYTFIYVLAQK